MTLSFLEFLKKQEVENYSHFDLKKVSAIGVGGRTRFAVFPKSEEEFIKVIDVLTDEKIKYKTVGKMTNILPSDEDFSGVLVFTTKMRTFSVAETRVYAECGVAFSRFLLLLSEKSLGGGEQLYGIPGSVGGMIYSNAGAYGKEICELCESVRLYFPSEKKLLDVPREKMEFSYRNQKYKGTDAIILGARLVFLPASKDEIRAGFSEITEKRKSTQPYGEKSLGSIFKRRGSLAVSFIVDELGLKGARFGGAMISDKHAGFIVNRGGATSLDIKMLISRIKNEVYAKYGFIPEEEIEYL